MPQPNDVLPPRYANPHRIGHGGMGEIFRAEDEVLGRTVAVKVLAERFSRDESIRARFTREALAAARLSSEPNTVTIFDVGEWRDRPFIVMEYLEGGSLEDRLKAGKPSTGQALRWLEETAEALDAAHRHGVVHRDVKPGNLLLSSDGAVRVADFGIASATGMDSLTMTGTVLGTAGYLAPEQAQGERATAASDRYALGIVAYELLSGSRPFESESVTAEAAAHVHAEIPSISERADLPRELDRVFQRALAKDPAERFDSSAQFVEAVRGGFRGGATTTREHAPTPRRRSSLVPLAGAFALAVGIAGAGLAAILTDGDDGASATPSVLVRTRTLQGTTVRQTVTQQPTSSALQTPPPPAVSGGNGVALTDQATRLIQSGDYAGAERAARQAVAALQGSGRVYEAYAEYNLGLSLAQLRRCSEAIPHLDRSESLQGRRKEIDRARKLCN